MFRTMRHRGVLALAALGLTVLVGGCVAYPAYPGYGYSGSYYGYGYPGYGGGYYPPGYSGGVAIYGGGWRGAEWRGAGWQGAGWNRAGWHGAEPHHGWHGAGRTLAANGR